MKKSLCTYCPNQFPGPENTNFKILVQVWGQISSGGISCTWVVMHAIKDIRLDLIGKKSKLCTGDTQAWKFNQKN